MSVLTHRIRRCEIGEPLLVIFSRTTQTSADFGESLRLGRHLADLRGRDNGLRISVSAMRYLIDYLAYISIFFSKKHHLFN